MKGGNSMIEKSENNGFFKLKKSKVFLTIALLVILLLVAYLYNSTFTYEGFEMHPNSAISGLLLFIAWPFVLITIMGFQGQINLGILLFVAIIIEILYSYLIACLIVRLYKLTSSKK